MTDPLHPKADEPQMPEPVAWACLTASGRIAYFDGRPMVMPGPVGNEVHPAPLITTASAQTYAEALAAHRVERAVAAERERYLSLVQATEDILEDGHMNTEYLARLRSGYLFVMDGAEDQPQVNSDGTPHCMGCGAADPGLTLG